MKSITVNKIDELIAQGAYVLDVRNLSERADEKFIEGVHHIALGDLAMKLNRLPKNQTIYIHCKSGMRSQTACHLLEEHGFDCYNIEGGYDAYYLAKVKHS